MLISVIIPVFNVEKYIKQCVDSVINQTYKDIEILLIDDGSTDRSGLICDEYQEIDSRIKVFHKENEGLGFTRNFGINHSNGKFLMFLDSDDFIDLDFIEKLVNDLENMDLIKSGFIRFDERNKENCTNYKDEKFLGNNRIKEFNSLILGSLPDKSDSLEMGVTASLYRSDVIKNNNVLFPSERELISEDLIFNTEFLKYAEKVKIVSYNGYHYRYNSNSLTRRYNPMRFDLCKKFYLYVNELIDENGLGVESKIRFSKMFFIYLRGCIEQEHPTISKKTKREILAKIKAICSDEVVVNCINDYPVKKLKFKQKIFICLIKHKRYNIVFQLLKQKII